MENHSDSYQCPCGRQFKRKSTYVRHMDITHSDSESHKCRVCEKTFGNASTLRMHMNIHQDSRNDAQIERLTRSRKHRTPSGGRDPKCRSSERLKSPVSKGDRSKQKTSVTSTERTEKDMSKTPAKQNKFPNNRYKQSVEEDAKVSQDDCIPSPIGNSEVVITTDNSHNDCVHMEHLNEHADSITELATVVVKTEPPSPPSPGCSESSHSVSPGAKENILPTVYPPSHISNSVTTHSHNVEGSIPFTGSINVEKVKLAGAVFVEKDKKVRLIDSTNMVHVPLQDSRRATSTIVIKLEDNSAKFIQQPPPITSHSVNSSVTDLTTATVTIPETVAAAAQIKTEKMDVESSDSEGETEEAETNVRKSTRLKGKMPGWRSWLEEMEQEEASVAGRKGFCRRKSCKVKLEGEDYEIIEQVVNMDMELALFNEELTKDVPLTGDEHLALSRASMIKHRDSNKNTIACPVCSKEFVSEKYLSMHMSLHRASEQEHLSPSTQDEDEPPVKRSKPSANGPNAHWTCKICNKTFAQNSNFKNHIRTHSDERPFVCEICCIGFKERYHLKKHMLFKHSDELKEECRICGKKFKDSTAVRAHERIHSDVRPYACRRCGKTFKTSECLWHHENRSKTCGSALDGIQPPASRFRRGRQARKVEPAVVKTEIPEPTETNVQLTPPQAGHLQINPVEPPIPTVVQAMGAAPPRQNVQIIATRPDNVLHMSNNVHREIPVNRPRIQLPTISSPSLVKICTPPDTPSPVISSQIDPRLPVVKVEDEIELPDYDLTGLGSESSTDDSSQDLDFHDLLNSDDDTDDLGSPLSLDDVDINQLDEQEEQDALFRNGFQSDLLEIKTDSSNKLRYTCVKCTKQYASMAAFEKHMATHSEMRPYKCNVCDIGFKLKVHLKKHNLYRHSNEYPCECSICGKKFKDSSAVRLHERIHSTDRPFKCECGKSFKTRENLWGHRHRGPCEKKDMLANRNMCISTAETMNYEAKAVDGQISAHASVSNNEIIARAIVSNNTVMARATIGDNGELMASALIQGPTVNAHASVNGSNRVARAQVGEKIVSTSSPVQNGIGNLQEQKEAPIPQTVMELQAKDEPVRSVANNYNFHQHNSPVPLPTAVVAPLKHEKQAPTSTSAQLSLNSPPLKFSSPPTPDKSLPPFETFAPTIMSILQRPPRLPPGVSLPHVANKQPPIQVSSYADLNSPKKNLSIAQRCPTIQKHLLQSPSPQIKLPGIQQLFQSHSLGHANRQQPRLMGSPIRSLPSSPRSASASPSPHIRLPPNMTHSSHPDASTPFLSDLPPPPPYPGNPNLGGPANTDFRCKTPCSFDGGPSPGVAPLTYWEDESSQDKKLSSGTVAWQTDTESLFHELTSSESFGQL